MPTLMQGKNPKTGSLETIPVPDCFIPSRQALGYVFVDPTEANARAAAPRLMKGPNQRGATFTAAKPDAPATIEAKPDAPATSTPAPAETAAQRQARRQGGSAPAPAETAASNDGQG
jgi:hypothetical protein